MTPCRLLPLLLLLPVGCAVAPPTAPTIAAMPGPGRDFQRFQQEEANCRGIAYQQVSAGAQAGTNAVVGSAAIGTALGAVAGGLVGSATGQAGAGAAVGAGTGLLAGGAVGASQAGRAGGNLQQRYDTVYAQCMTAAGNTIQGPAYAMAGPYQQPQGYPQPQAPYGYRQPQAYPPQAYYPAPGAPPVAAYPGYGGYYAAPAPYGWAR
ncbi:hypothetical protein [Falsiroseomonas sp. HW251]|uniref:hypothetical protein n=1 Tax=Falsiroseomonas sp. HW251 TaxID=3390998 RepID=UPI003D3221F9